LIEGHYYGNENAKMRSEKFASTKASSITTLLIFLLLASSCTFSYSSSLPPPDTTNNTATVFPPVVKLLDPKVTYDNIIPPINYTIKGYKEITGLQYPPVAVANKCLFYFSHVRNETAFLYGLYVAEWLALRSHQSADGFSIYFTHDYPLSHYNLTAGWKSALAQALAAECFLEAYSYTGNSTFVDLAKKSLMFLRVPVSGGGVMIDEGNERWWYEEYPRPSGNKQPQVLNGHQFVLLSLNEYLHEIDNNDMTIRQLFDNGLNALKSDALLYDNGYNYSFYDRLGGLAKGYHNTHIINFQKLYDITGDIEWLSIKEVFEE
jgi:hypothetical protein